MKKFADIFFSMQLTVVLLLMFALSAAVATFIENDFGTTAAKIAVYNATWFEILLLILAVNLGGSLVVNRIWQRKKYVQFIFHVAFIVILLGAAITRYYGFEGMMHIRQGESAGHIVSDKTYISASFSNGGTQTTVREEVLLSGNGKQRPGFSFHAGEDKMTIKTLDFIPNAALEVIKAPEGDPVVSLFLLNGMNRQSVVLKENDTYVDEDITISFNGTTGENILNISLEGDELYLSAPFPLFVMSMGGQVTDTVNINEKTRFLPMLLYTFNDYKIVLKQFENSAILRPVKAGKDEQSHGTDALLVEVRSGTDRQEAILWGERGMIGEVKTVYIDGHQLTLSYGSVPISIPFQVRLNKFILDRYPGSNSPSSYASEVTLIDKNMNRQFDFRIYMNHILKYKGYRFYQSSYDTDEKGTILSVNHDALGTSVSYFGYFLMSLGMILALFTRRTRFDHILRSITEIRKKRISSQALFFLMGLFIPALSFGAGEVRNINGIRVEVVDYDHASNFGKLITLSTNSRIEPMNTLSSKILIKLAGKSSFNGLNSDQVFLGIISQPEKWQHVPMIKIGNRELQEMLKINGKYAAFSDFFDPARRNSYRLSQLVNEAYQKEQAHQSKLDKEIIRVDEKVNIFYLLYNGSYLKLFPKSTDPAEKWFYPGEEVNGIPEDDSLFIKNIMNLYIESLNNAFQSGDYTQANELVDAVKTYQVKYAASILPSQAELKIEVLYNKAEIFERLYKIYGLLGLVFMIILFGNLVFPKFKIDLINKVFFIILFIGFVLQTLGLAGRWYISGHAPMSNGYESMIFIAWATMLAGFILGRKSNIALAATTLLASVTLFVAHLNWMNPEVTNLVPVLKSIWLTIHVAIITGSYGFLGLGAILGLFNLFLMIFMNRKNFERFNLTIREISYTSEATLTIGLYMITIGTFLGAVWANESWGRYWGWDPKETWALITVLVYAVIIHLNFIPGVMGHFLFNALSVLGFSSVLMTYFGVNYYLSGLHSYAAGDPVPVPTFVYYSIAILTLILVLAYLNNARFKTSLVDQDKEN